MNQLQTLQALVKLDGDSIVTDSLIVADEFNKRHKNVLQAFDNLECSPEFNRLNFQPVEYIDSKGERRRMIKMTKDGFLILAMASQALRPCASKRRLSLLSTAWRTM